LVLTDDDVSSDFKLRAVVLPMCSGKSVAAHLLSGYDIDDVVVNEQELVCDHEFDAMIGAREDAIVHGEVTKYAVANDIMLRRAKRFFSKFSGDSNAHILYVHTVELAVALNATPIFVGDIAESCMASTARMQAHTPSMRKLLCKVACDQGAANRAYCARHGIPHAGTFESYSLMLNSVWDAAYRSGAVYDTRMGVHAYKQVTEPGNHKAMLSSAYAALRNDAVPMWVRAVAARRMWSLVGDAAPQEAQYHHNHPTWARVIAASVQHELPVRDIPDLDETGWAEKFPYGPGNSKFALARIGDWISRTEPESLRNGYVWFKQLLNRDDCTYERALCTLVMGDVWSYVRPDVAELATRIPLGALSPQVYGEVAKAIHAGVRSSNTFLGRKLQTKDLAVFTYWDCIAGRYAGDADVEKEISDRTRMLEPKTYILPDGTKSKNEFDRRFDEAVRAVLHATLRDGPDRLLKHVDMTKDLGTFIEFRKAWVRPGSMSGSPKADIYLKVVGEREAKIGEVADDLHMMGMYVLRKVRLNKAAVFEFSEFPKLVKDVIGDYVPNSFTRHFVKNEIAKPKGRVLFPSHGAHYVVSSFVLYLLMRGAPVDHARLLPDEAVNRDEHWLWRQARDFTVGLMLDYDNFNESHEIREMQMVISSLKDVYARVYALSADMRAMIDWVVEAYSRTLFEYEGELHLFLHGMLSGQGPTAMINTTINAANKRIVRDQIADLYSVTTMTNRTSGGDDVAAEVYDVSTAAMIVKVGAMMGFAFKASKQLISTTNYEFFRLFVSSDGTYGSLPRALGSLCSGQWSNSVKAKFIDPASKLGSVVEMARKVGRRSGNNITFMDKLCASAFTKWATYGEHKLLLGYIHGSRASGGLGIPTADGSIFTVRLSGQETKPSTVELVGLPNAASIVVAERTVRDATDLLGKEACVQAADLAQSMAQAVFLGNVASAEGVGVAQLLTDINPPTAVQVIGVKRIAESEYAGTTIDVYRLDMAKYSDECARYKTAGARYDSLAGAVLPRYRRQLAHIIALATRVDEHKLYHWRESLTLYGCDTYMLTEDYYGAVQRLAIVTATEATDDAVSHRLALYAVSLGSAGLMYY
jgi:hypothetical protein